MKISRINSESICSEKEEHDRFFNPYMNIPYFPDDQIVDLRMLTGVENAPLELEIGFGRGHFLLDRGRAAPAHGIIGLETKRKGVFTAVTRKNKHQIYNIHPFHGDVFSVLPRIQPESCIERCFVHFPDPWWKLRHEKRIVVCAEIITEIARLLVDNGELFIQTDVPYRAEQYSKLLLESALFYSKNENGMTDENPYNARSLREKKCIAGMLPIYRLLFLRQSRSKENRL